MSMRAERIKSWKLRCDLELSSHEAPICTSRLCVSFFSLPFRVIPQRWRKRAIASERAGREGANAKPSLLPLFPALSRRNRFTALSLLTLLYRGVWSDRQTDRATTGSPTAERTLHHFPLLLLLLLQGVQATWRPSPLCPRPRLYGHTLHEDCCGAAD